MTKYLNELFFDDPLSFKKMSSLLKDPDFGVETLRAELKKIADQAGMVSDHAQAERIEHAVQRKAWFLRSIEERKLLKTTLTSSDRESLLKGMLLTRATDNALKHLFLSGEMLYRGQSFSGKGFRSLGQEAIYGAPWLLRHGPAFYDNGVYTGDFAAPLIRDLGVFLAMSGDDVLSAINAQAAKIGKPCHGRDFHLGDFSKGLFIASAPLAIATCTLIGFALSFQKKREPRVALSFIGEGGSSLGEWHEAINFAAVLKLPMVFCIENNQIALSTPTGQQSKARSFADKALGYGINSLVVDGNDIEEIAVAFKFASDEARMGRGPVLIEVLTMRMCGHAHHDDMLYLGQDPPLKMAISPNTSGGYRDLKLYEHWQKRDPITHYAATLLEEGIISKDLLLSFEEAALHRVKEAVAEIKARPWPRFDKTDSELVFKKPWLFSKTASPAVDLKFSETGVSYLQAIAFGIKQSFIDHKNCYVIGEDVAPPYGNAFMMFKDLRSDFSDRFINTPISENAIVGACVGMAMAGLLPIGELQFNDFVASAMDQVVNNAAKNFFRLGQNVPMVLRMPYGGLRRAGPFHSQDSSPWFYRTPGLKIMAPATPLDALLMLKKAVEDPDPVLFYEHIALYRDPKIKQQLSDLSAINIDGAQVLLKGSDLTLVAYGAYVHVALKAARALFELFDKRVEVIDLRYLMPVDFSTLHASLKKTSRILLVGEDSKTGGILESIASRIGEECYRDLDAPPTVLGSRDLPVPYAPSLEEEFLLSQEQIQSQAKRLMEF